MIKKIVNVVLAFCFVTIASFAFADQPPPVDFQRNDDALTLTQQPNTAPIRVGASIYGEAFVAPKPGQGTCSVANTGTTAVNILAGVANVSHVVSSVDCVNTTTTASTITLKNDLATIGFGYIGTTTLGNNTYRFTFPNSIKVDGAKPLTFTMGTTSTSTTCCANYVDRPNTTPTATNTPTPTNTATPTLTPTATATP